MKTIYNSKDADKLMETFRNNLADLCNENLETQKSLAEKVGCNHGTISNYISGETLPSLDMIIKIADYFETTPDELIGYPSKAEEEKQRFFSEKTGLSTKTIEKLYDYKKWGDHQEDIEALNYLIRYNDETDEGLTLLRCLYEAIYNQPLKIDITDTDSIKTYYNDSNYFLEPHLKSREHIHMSDIYIMMVSKKINYIVKEKIWKLDKIKKATKEHLKQKISRSKLKK